MPSHPKIRVSQSQPANRAAWERESSRTIVRTSSWRICHPRQAVSQEAFGHLGEPECIVPPVSQPANYTATRTATGLIRTSTQWTNLRPRSTETRINKLKTGRSSKG